MWIDLSDKSSNWIGTKAQRGLEFRPHLTPHYQSSFDAYKLFDWLLLYNVWHSNIETRSVSIYKLQKYGQERDRRESNKWHAINTQQENQTFAELHEQALGKQEHNISSYKENENTQRGRERRTVLICDDERDLLSMFAIALQESYDVLTAKSG